VCSGMLRISPRASRMLLAVALAAALAGCGKSAPMRLRASGPAAAVAPVAAQGAVSVVTKNTTRLGGADAASDAAAVARAVYPGLTPATRPQVVVVVDEHNWAAALAAAVMASTPIRAPLLYSDGAALPEVSLQALEAMRPTGSPALGGTQVILLGSSAAAPGGYASRTVAVPTTNAAEAAAAVERLFTAARSASPRQVIMVASDARRAIQMPAAGLAAESGAPILFAASTGVPPATGAVLSRLRRPSIYLLGFSSIAKGTLGELAHLGRVSTIAPSGTLAEAPTPVGNAIAVARFTDGVFGWGVKEPGHGLVFANAGRPLDAPAAAPLSATGQYGPLLLLDRAEGVPSSLASYLSDIQPAYGKAPQYQPVHGAYNHGWLIGNESAISPPTQAEIDAMLEIVPAKAASEETASASP
jgi:predicted small lipoprotein YifL